VVVAVGESAGEAAGGEDDDTEIEIE